MNLKSIVTLFLFVLIAAAGCGGAASDATVPLEDFAPAIEAVLLQAEKADDEAENSHSFMSTSTTLKKLIGALQGIDLRECPDDFRHAFLSYITAMENFVPFSEKYDDVSFYSMFVNTTELITQGPGRLSEVVDEGKRLKQSLLAARQVVKETGLR